MILSCFYYNLAFYFQYSFGDIDTSVDGYINKCYQYGIEINNELLRIKNEIKSTELNSVNLNNFLSLVKTDFKMKDHDNSKDCTLNISQIDNSDDDIKTQDDRVSERRIGITKAQTIKMFNENLNNKLNDKSYNNSTQKLILYLEEEIMYQRIKKIKYEHTYRRLSVKRYKILRDHLLLSLKGILAIIYYSILTTSLSLVDQHSTNLHTFYDCSDLCYYLDRGSKRLVVSLFLVGFILYIIKRNFKFERFLKSSEHTYSLRCMHFYALTTFLLFALLIIVSGFSRSFYELDVLLNHI